MKRWAIVTLTFLAFFLVAVTLDLCYAVQSWINQTVQVPAGGSYYWSGTLYSGNRLQGSFTVSSGGDIKFYITDAANYAKYSNEQSFLSYYKNQAVQVPQVDFTVPYDGTWFVLLDNSYSIWTNKVVTVTLSLNSSETPIGTWFFLGFIAILIVGIVAYAYNEAKKRKNQPANVPT